MYQISKYAADGQGRARALGYSEPIENEAGELTSQTQLYLLSKKVIMRIFVALFTKTQYDFNLNQEVPLINPFTYFAEVGIDVMVLDLGDGEDLE